MSIYLASDIHGHFGKFKSLLAKIKFSPEKDFMYILGDVLDRGDENLALLEYVRGCEERGCMKLLKGNHELFAQLYLQNGLSRNRWELFGGEETVREIERLSEREKLELKNYLSKLPHYIELDVTSILGNRLNENANCDLTIENTYRKKWLLTHSGFCVDYICEVEEKIDTIASIKIALQKSEYNYLISDDLHYLAAGIYKKLDHYVVVGHLPVNRIREDGKFAIYQNKYYMDIDTGSYQEEFGGKVSCYRIEDGAVFYC